MPYLKFAVSSATTPTFGTEAASRQSKAQNAMHAQGLSGRNCARAWRHVLQLPERISCCAEQKVEATQVQHGTSAPLVQKRSTFTSATDFAPSGGTGRSTTAGASEGARPGKLRRLTQSDLPQGDNQQARTHVSRLALDTLCSRKTTLPSLLRSTTMMSVQMFAHKSPSILASCLTLHVL